MPTPEQAKARSRDKLRKSDLLDLLSSESGRRLAWWLVGEGDAFRSTFVPDAMQMAYREGVRSKAQDLYRELLEVSPSLVALMQSENPKQ
jgi:hypothetical protein